MSEQQKGTETQAGRSRGKLLLGISLALNMAFVGLLAGAALRHGGDHERGPEATSFGTPYMRALPREARQSVLRSARLAGDAQMLDRAARKKLFDNVLASMRATPFDAEHMQRLVTEQARVSVAVQKSVQTAWVAAVESMTDAERLAYADAVEDILRRGPKPR